MSMQRLRRMPGITCKETDRESAGMSSGTIDRIVNGIFIMHGMIVIIPIGMWMHFKAE